MAPRIALSKNKRPSRKERLSFVVRELALFDLFRLGGAIICSASMGISVLWGGVTAFLIFSGHTIGEMLGLVFIAIIHSWTGVFRPIERTSSLLSKTTTHFFSFLFFCCSHPFRRFRIQGGARNYTRSLFSLRLSGNRETPPMQRRQTIVSPRHSRKKESTEIYFELPRNWHRRIAAFFVIACILVLPFHLANIGSALAGIHDKLRDTTHSALARFQNGAQEIQQLNTVGASDDFSSAFEEFSQAQQMIGTIQRSVRLLVSAIPFEGRKLHDGEELIAAGKELSEAGLLLSQGVVAVNTSTGSTKGSQTLYAALVSAQDALKRTEPLILSAYSRMKAISANSLPGEYRAEFEKGRSNLERVSSLLPQADTLIGTLLSILGKDEKRHYLLVLQNNTELRPTGGFIGTFSRMDVNRGAILSLSTPGGGSYDLQGALTQHVIAPQPLHIVNSTWEFQDANWYPDFPTSARKLLWFYDHAGQSSVDGVIALNASFAQHLIEFTGPIALPAYGKVITKDNFIEETQKAVEIDYDRSKNTPKQFLADLLLVMMQRISSLESADSQKLASIFIDGARDKEIQLYMKDAEEQATLSQYDLTGEVKQTTADYLMIVDANVGGWKSDAVIASSVDHSIQLNADGTLNTTLTITRHHGGTPGNHFYGQKNINYMRVYVPEGSTLLTAQGFTPPDPKTFKPVPPFYSEDTDVIALEGVHTTDVRSGTDIHTEHNKTVFGNWIQTLPGATSTVQLTYKLPFTKKDLTRAKNAQTWYPLLVQRQSGSTIHSYSLSISSPLGSASKILYPKESVDFTQNEHFNRSPFIRDFAVGVVFKEL